jgi:hypothetical protein
LLRAVFPQRERLFEPFRDFVEELLRAFVDGFRRAGAFLGMGFFFVVFLIALRAAVAEADFFPGLVFPRLDAEAAFVFEARFFPPRAFFVLPARVSTKAVTALDATFIAASTFALAASAIASCADVLNPAFSFSMIASFPDSSRNRHTQRGQCSHQQKLCMQDLRFGVPPATKRGAAPSSWLDGLFSAECREVELPVSFQDSGKEFDLRASSLGCVGKIHEQHGDVRGQGRINAAPASSIARIVEHGASDFDLSVGKPPS